MSKNEETLTYEPMAGQHIFSASDQAIKLSCETGKKVQFKFNRVSVVVNPDSTPEQAVQFYDDECNRQAEAYRNSPEGKAEIAAREDAIATKSNRLNEMVDNLDATLEQGTAATMDWLAEYADLADDVAVDGRYPEVIEKLEAAGYSQEDSSFDRETTTVTADVMAKYVAANAIIFMKDGMAPHPSLTNRFVGEYKQLANAGNDGGGSPQTPAFG